MTQSCLFCGAGYEPRAESMPPPSSACQKCWLTINAALSQREPDFTPANSAKINYMPDAWVLL